MTLFLLDDIFRSDLLLHAILLNIAWLTIAACVFLLLFRSARAHGFLLQVGE